MLRERDAELAAVRVAFRIGPIGGATVAVEVGESLSGTTDRRGKV